MVEPQILTNEFQTKLWQRRERQPRRLQRRLPRKRAQSVQRRGSIFLPL